MSKILVLSAADVERCLSEGGLVDAMEKACREVSAREAQMPIRLTMRVPNRDGVLSAMPAYLPGYPALATKLVTAFAGNPERGLPLVLGVVVLNDSETGAPLAVMDGAVITGRRTAATSALSARVLAREDASRLAVIGSGLQARTHVEALADVRPIREVRVSSRSLESAQRFARTLSASRPPFSVNAVSNAQEAVHEADIVVCATTAADPVLRREWLQPGAHLCAVGSHSPNKRELDSETVAGCSVIAVDTRDGCLAEADDLRIPLREGRITPDRIVELGELLLGTARGRSSAEEITLYKSVGMAAMDAASARLIYDRALGAGLGVEAAF